MKTRLADYLRVAVPKVLGGIGMFAISLVLMQYLGPEPFARYALCITGIMLADAIIGTAFDLGVLRLAPLYRQEQRTRSLGVEKAAIVMKLLGVAGAGIMLALLAPQLSLLLFHDAGSERLIYIGVVAALGLLLLRSAQVHLQVEGKFAKYGRVDLAHQALKYGGIALVVWLIEPSVEWALWAIAAAPLIVLAAMPGWMKSVWREGGGFVPPMRELLVFIKWYLVTFAVTAVFARLDLFMLTTLGDLHATGIYAAAAVFMMIPELLGSYMSVVLSPRIMPAVKSGTFGPFMRRFQAGLVALAVLLCVLGVASLGWLGRFVIPPGYTESTRIILILLPGALAMMASFPLAIPYLMFVRPSYILKLEGMLAPLAVVAYIVVIPRHGAVGAAWVTTAFRVLKAGLMQAAMWKSAGVEYRGNDTALPAVALEGAAPGSPN